MRCAIAILLGNTKVFHEVYYIAARNGGGLKHDAYGRFGCIILPPETAGGLKQMGHKHTRFIATILPPERAED